jgi:nitroimidazol reductase NimA-like FMN-containing flavoprotein (pyridoxamine 5'-phosphate oxidase superfamily)
MSKLIRAQDRLDDDELTLVRLRRLNTVQIEEVVKNQEICRIAFNSESYPYVAPFQYVVMEGILYFHLTEYGRKMRLLEKDNRVCVEIERYAPDFSEYSFVGMMGRLELVEDPTEKDRAIQKLSQDGARKLSVNFLAAHGLKREEGWSSLPNKKPLHVARLEADEVIGLTSPYSR